MLDLSILSQSKVENILDLYSKFRQTENEKFIAEIDLILRNEFANPKIHSHFKSVSTKALPKKAKEYVSINAD